MRRVMMDTSLLRIFLRKVARRAFGWEIHYWTGLILTAFARQGYFSSLYPSWLTRVDLSILAARLAMARRGSQHRDDWMVLPCLPARQGRRGTSE